MTTEATGDYAEISKGKDGQWYARRKAQNHEIVSTSEGYERRESAVKWAARQGLFSLDEGEEPAGDEDG